MNKGQPSTRLSMDEDRKNKQNILSEQRESLEDRTQQKITGTEDPRFRANAANKKSTRDPITAQQASGEKRVPNNGASIVRRSLDEPVVELASHPHNHEHEMIGQNTDPGNAVKFNQQGHY